MSKFKSKPRNRSVAVLYSTLSAMLLIAILAMALIVRPPPPPSIAELGPSPHEQIKEARNDQSAGYGKAGLTTGTERAKNFRKSRKSQVVSEVTSTATQPSDQPPAAHRCFGNPPRQTEDPHSPPCVSKIFHGNNGGATAQGVSSTKISIAWPADDGNACGKLPDTFAAAEAMLAHFNSRYEFYGRRMVFEYVSNSDAICPDGQRSDPSDANAYATKIIDLKPFVSIVEANKPFHGNFHRQLNDAGIISVNYNRPLFQVADLVDGWVWFLSPPVETSQNLGGEFLCRAFTGGVAIHAGPGVAGKRKIAVISISDQSGQYPDVRTLESRLGNCDADFEVFQDAAGTPSSRHELALQLKRDNFTTVVPVYSQLNVAGLLMAASNVGYFPEWFMLDDHVSHTELFLGNPNFSEQASQVFGFTSDVRVRRESEIPAYWAIQDSGGPANPGQETIIEPIYKKLLVVASGVQMAGQNLNPETFRRALWNTIWPNPHPGGPPYWQQRVSFAPGDPVFYSDYAIWWWNENAETQQDGDPRDPDGRGSFCYLERGGRFLAGTFPSNADRRLFNPDMDPCR